MARLLLFAFEEIPEKASDCPRARSPRVAV
jgi:hypothetical protein